jgi:hypothetical protein
VTGVIIRPNNHIFVPVPIDVWRIETCYKRAPGDIFHTNTRCNSMETMYRNKIPQSTPLKNTHGIRPLLGRCDDPNHRWWTGANRPRFTFLAFVAALTKVRPPLFFPTERVFHPVCKGVPDPNLVYPLLSTLCLPSPAAGTARFSGLEPTPVTRVTTAFKHVQIAIARYRGVMRHKYTRVQATHPFLCCYSFNNRLRRRLLHLRA